MKIICGTDFTANAAIGTTALGARLYMNNVFLAQLVLFHSLDAEEIDALMPFLDRTFAKKGETLFSRGETRDRLRVVETGRVRLEMAEAGMGDWDEYTTVFGPGQFMGEATLPIDQRCKFFRWENSVKKFGSGAQGGATADSASDLQQPEVEDALSQLDAAVDTS